MWSSEKLELRARRMRERQAINDLSKTQQIPPQVAKRILSQKPYVGRNWSALNRKRYQIKTGRTILPCRCWQPSCPACMRTFQSRMDILDRMILAGWGDTPGVYIPPTYAYRHWRGPGTVELVRPELLTSATVGYALKPE
jgi:hypothetical protein